MICAVSEKVLAAVNRNLILLLYTVEEVEIDMVCFYIQVNTVTFQHNNNWKGFFFLHIMLLFRLGPKDKKICALFRTTKPGHPGNTSCDSFTVNPGMLESEVTT